MVYKNIENTASFASAGGLYAGEDDATVALESDEYTFVKTANPQIWSGDGQLSYTITLTSVTGPDLSDITVTDILPADVEFLPNTVVIDSEPTTDNFDDSAFPTIRFGTLTPLTVTNIKPLEITFQVEKA